ncbi:hypothetical protein GRJ2_000956500 [Grus japonensis]|uniref:Uncharacterized protein n=1 Tax=Grus japonensis TaxID=30415 RepID=A0ABC9WKQ0_GRUJA
MTVTLPWVESSAIKSSTSDDRNDAKFVTRYPQLKFFWKTGSSRQIAHVAAAGLNKKRKGWFSASLFLQLHLSMLSPSLFFVPASISGKRQMSREEGGPAAPSLVPEPPPAAKGQTSVTSPVVCRRVGTEMRRRTGVGCQVCHAWQPPPVLRRDLRKDVAVGKCSQSTGDDFYDKRTPPNANINIKTGDTAGNVQVYLE